MCLDMKASSALLGLLALSSCTPLQPIQPPPEVNEPSAAPKEVELRPTVSTPPPDPTAEEVAKAPPATPEPSVEPVIKFSGAFATPESVLYDEASDRYLVSNINGKPSEVDANGYILELAPDGRVTNPKLIAGGVNRVKLDAPKGMAIVGSELWVTDISLVRKFDLKSARYKGDIELPGATFANDIVATGDGGAYVSDSAVKFGVMGPEPLGGDQVFAIDKAGKVKVLAKNKELAGPNGLAIGQGNMLLVNSLLGDEVYSLAKDGKRDAVTKVPGGQLDGLLAIDNYLIVSSWKTETVYRGPLGGAFTPVLTKVKGAADIGYDSKRKRLLVPRFMDDTVEVYELK
jgi:hypothetical protein